MKQNPSKLPFRKYHKPNSFYLSSTEEKVFYPSNGFFALKTLESGRITFKHIEAVRRSIRRNIKKLVFCELEFSLDFLLLRSR